MAAIVVVNAWSGLMPGVGFWDTGEFQTVLPILGTAHPTGYPTYVLIGWVANLVLTPFGEPAFRINILSLLAVAGAAALTVELVRRLTASLAIGVATGLGLALTPVVWANATRADPHPLHLFFVALILLLLVGWEAARGSNPATADRWLVAAAATFGLSAGNHSLTLLLAPPIGLYVLAVEPGIVRRPRFVGACVIALAVAVAGVYLELPIRSGLLPAPLVYARPNTWDGFWYIALAEQFRGSLSHPLDDLGRKAADLWTFAQGQLGIAALLVPFGFLATLRRAPRYALLTGVAMVITVVFNASYSNADINRYYLGPVLWAWTWVAMLAAMAVDLIVAVWSALARRGSLGPAMGAASVIVAAALLLPSLQALDAHRRAADRHAATDASLWLDDVLPHLAQDAVVVSWWSTSTPLWYAELVDRRRPDIAVIDDRTIIDRGYGSANGAISAFLGTRPVYIIRANPGDLAGVQAVYQLQIVAGSGSLAVYEVMGAVNGTG
ncbi:MAG: DUF2723 domain-containing protein [Chloroflexi bacterium]|nr:DUF2723 domain-containing protein [Chloroflexota bacterium]